jgi:hypothetical protein
MCISTFLSVVATLVHVNFPLNNYKFPVLIQIQLLPKQIQHHHLSQ